jgi:hypothetical protein
MGAQASAHGREHRQAALKFIEKHLPAASKPLDWDDVEGSVLEHSMKNTILNQDRCSLGGRTHPHPRSVMKRWKAFKIRKGHAVSWADGVDASARLSSLYSDDECSSSSRSDSSSGSSSSSTCSNDDDDGFTDALPLSAQQLSALWLPTETDSRV